MSKGDCIYTATIELIDAEENNLIKDAKETAKLIADKLPIIYGISGMESVAIRFRQQLNDKSTGFHGTYLMIG